MEDLQEYVQQQNKIIEELRVIERSDFETKKQYIIRLKEVTRPLVEAGYYDGIKLEDLASFIQKNLLSKYGISYNNSGDYYALFREDEKHSEKNPMSSRPRDKISSPLPLEKQTGDDVIDKLKQASRSGETIPENYQYAKYLLKVNETANETIKQSDSLLRKLGSAFYYIDKFDKQFPNKKELEQILRTTGGNKQKELQELYTHYQLCNKVIEDIESGIGTTDDKIDELNETLSIQKFNSKQIDERSKITFLEKWNIIVCQINLGISAIAKKLGINKKHISNNIRPTENPVTHQKNMHHEYVDWFTAIKVVSPSGEEFVFDAKAYFDEQIERGKLHIPFKPMVLKNCDLS